VLRLLGLGLLGYIGYRFVRDQQSTSLRPAGSANAVAGGPLGEHASLQSDPDVPPADDPYVTKGG
jgi:hypothetical protein